MGRAVATVEVGRSAFKILTGRPMGERALQRPGHRWGDDI